MRTVRHVDVIVVGLGTVGAATCMELARRGGSVMGFDALAPPHNRGSHHGESRSIRKAYMEGTAYVPMAIRSWELWRKLEQASGKTLLVKTENLTIGPPDCPAVSGFLKSARAYDIPHEVMTASAVRSRWPQLAMPEPFIAGVETDAGILYAEPAIETMCETAQRYGAILHINEPVLRWEEGSTHIRVVTPMAGYTCGQLVLAAVAHNTQLMGRTDQVLSVKRVPVCWFTPSAQANFNLGAFPVNFWQLPREVNMGSGYSEMYALPCTRSGGMVKVAPHNDLTDADPSRLANNATNVETNRVRTFIEHYIPDLDAGHIRAVTCLYTLTPDHHFWLGPLPGRRRVLIAALSGHGFKFAPVLGEILTDMLQGRDSPYDVSIFSPERPPPNRSI